MHFQKLDFILPGDVVQHVTIGEKFRETLSAQALMRYTSAII